MKENKYMYIQFKYIFIILINLLLLSNYLFNNDELIDCERNNKITNSKIKNCILGRWKLLYQKYDSIYIEFDSNYVKCYDNRKILDKNKYEIRIEKDTNRLINKNDSCNIHYLVTDDGVSQIIEGLSNDYLYLLSTINGKTDKFKRVLTKKQLKKEK